MTQITYTVSVSIMFESKAEEWLEWLKNGHIDDVRKGGAASAEIVKLDPHDEAQRETIYEIRYRFADRSTFDDYLENHAPRLRREGLEKFPLEDGFKYSRSVGEILE